MQEIGDILLKQVYRTGSLKYAMKDHIDRIINIWITGHQITSIEDQLTWLGNIRELAIDKGNIEVVNFLSQFKSVGE